LWVIVRVSAVRLAAATTLIDYVLVQDPEGKPLPLRNIVVLNIPAKKAGTSEAVTMVFGGFIAEAGVPGPYGVYGPAKITAVAYCAGRQVDDL